MAKKEPAKVCVNFRLQQSVADWFRDWNPGGTFVTFSDKMKGMCRHFISEISIERVFDECVAKTSAEVGLKVSLTKALLLSVDSDFSHNEFPISVYNKVVECFNSHLRIAMSKYQIKSLDVGRDHSYVLEVVRKYCGYKKQLTEWGVLSFDKSV